MTAIEDALDKSGLYTCRFHPTNSWHEVGCPHQDWTFDELSQAKKHANALGPTLKGADIDRQLTDKIKQIKEATKEN